MIPFPFKKALQNLNKIKKKPDMMLIPWSLELRRFELRNGKNNSINKFRKKSKQKTLNFVNRVLMESAQTSEYYLPDCPHFESCLRIFALVTFISSMCLIGGLLYLSLENISYLKELLFYSGLTYFFLVIVFGIFALLFIQFDNQGLGEREKRFNIVLDKLNTSHFYSRKQKWKCGKYGSYLVVMNFGVILKKAKEVETKVMVKIDQINSSENES